MFSVQLHKLCFYQLGGVVVPGNADRLSPGTDGFQHEVYNFIQPVPVKLHILYENVIVDIFLDDLPVNLKSVLCFRFLSFPFRRRSRFLLQRRGVRGMDRNGMGTL